MNDSGTISSEESNQERSLNLVSKGEETSHQNLDEYQLKVVESLIDSNVRCVAPAGHGKTMTAAWAVNYFLQNRSESAGENIVVISFTKAAVKAIREKLLGVNKKNAAIFCMTIDSFAGHLCQIVRNECDVSFESASYDENILNAIKLIEGFGLGEATSCINHFERKLI